jgi:hypothetical protein
MFTPKGSLITMMTRELQQEIRRLDLIDTYDMIESVRLKFEVLRSGQLRITIFAMEYYRYLDSMSDSFKSTTVGSRQSPGYPITRNWLNNSKVQNAMAQIAKDYFNYLRQTYPILNFDKLETELSSIDIQFEGITF